jgi:hypothetical protein
MPTTPARFTSKPRLNFKERAKAATWHLALSLAAALLAAALVFWLWYPGPYRNLSGGSGLFFLVVSVDVVLGPVLTFAIFDKAKGWPHLRRDLTVIVALQLAALVYGLHTVYVARPVALVFEKDRFRVISAADVYQPELPEAAADYQRLPLTGPWTLGLRDVSRGDESNDAVLMAVLQGVDTSQRPIFWVPYAQTQAKAAARARPLADLHKRYPAETTAINGPLLERGIDPVQARFLPVIARGNWVALLDGKGEVVGFVPVDGYF